jgi:virginiamycin B lyase
MTKTKLFRVAAAIVAVCGAVAIAALAVPARAQNLPNGNGKDVVETVCAACHDLSPITEGGFSREDWDTVVQSMIMMGAALKPDQAALVTNYLAANFPPKSKQ